MVESAPEPGEITGIDARDKASDTPPAPLDYARPEPRSPWPPALGIFIGSTIVSLLVSTIMMFCGAVAVMSFASIRLHGWPSLVIGLMFAGCAFITAGWLVYTVIVPGHSYDMRQRLAVRLGVAAAAFLWSSVLAAALSF
jgi:hypothetical protein